MTRHIHIAERCEHGSTKQTCGHQIAWSAYRVRSVPCGPTFCEVTGSGGQSLEDLLRQTEKDIAADPEEHGVTAELWEQVRQWPGEFHKEEPGEHDGA